MLLKNKIFLFDNHNKFNKNNNVKIDENNCYIRIYAINSNYQDYDKEIIISKIISDSGWLISLNEARFINRIIRKNKLKNCLEIGVAN